MTEPCLALVRKKGLKLKKNNLKKLKKKKDHKKKEKLF